MKNFCILSRPYSVAGDQNTVVYHVQTIEFPAILLHSDRTLQRGTDRLTKSGRTTAAFPSEDKAYLAINDYYVLHGEPTPYVRLGGTWHCAAASGGGQTTAWLEPDMKSEPMEFE